MPALAWADSLALAQPLMDRTHVEFVELLAAARTPLVGGDRVAGLAAFERLLDHTVEHFGQEDRWMAALGFAVPNCHTQQHELVLQLMREVLRLVREDDRWDAIEVLADELGAWFPQHAGSLDAGLAATMQELGFDPEAAPAAPASPAESATA
jgi:hemerythrin-like metal-binding protein